MPTDYIQAAMRKAHYEILPDGEGYFGSIPDLQGVCLRLKRLRRIGARCPSHSYE